MLVGLACIVWGINSGRGPDLKFIRFETNFAGSVDAYYAVPPRTPDKWVKILNVYRQQPSGWSKEVMAGEPELADETGGLVRVPLQPMGEAPNPGQRCRVVAIVTTTSFKTRLFLKLGIRSKTALPGFEYDKMSWITNEISVPR